MPTLTEAPSTGTTGQSTPVHLPDLIVGVDTHRDTHTAVIVDSRGAVLAELTVATTLDGLSELFTTVADLALNLDPTEVHNPAAQILWAIEGSGSYGTGLRRFLQTHTTTDPAWIAEVSHLTRSRGRGKNDALDAQNIARHAHHQVLDHHRNTLSPNTNTRNGPHRSTGRGRASTTPPPTPRTGSIRAAIAVITRNRAANVADRTAAINRFKATIVEAPEPVRVLFRGASTTNQLKTAASSRARTSDDFETSTYRHQLRALARRIHTLDLDIKTDTDTLDELTTRYAAPLRAQLGYGPVVTAAFLIAHSHPGRIHSEAAFARLAGVAPIEASSGQNTHHRLDRNGDRHLNTAAHRVVMIRRQQQHPDTINYIERRTAEGKTTREITRCLKRAVVRSAFRILEQLPPMP